MLTEKDKIQLRDRNISEIQVAEQLERLRKGTSYVHLLCPATIGNGILKFDDDLSSQMTDVYENDKQYYRLSAFIPASGAASRMFKDLYSFIESYDGKALPSDFMTTNSPAALFFRNIDKFAFHDDLEKTLNRLYGHGIQAMMDENRFVDIAKALLADDGLSYGSMPKGLVRFHRYDGFNRNAIEEHLVEAAKYAKNADNTVKVHFTVSPGHESMFLDVINEVKPHYEKDFHCTYDISLSFQKASTDTIAMDADGNLFRNEDGTLLFRPAGHGALIENLNDFGEEIVFIKNIDNVVKEDNSAVSIKYKKVLAGCLLHLQQQCFEYLDMLDEGCMTEDEINETARFAQNELMIDIPSYFNEYGSIEKIDFLYNRLNRPMRVCGVVKNVGEPGGGPYWVKNQDDEISLQIVESSQINHGNEKQEALFLASTHFNPVDLVCGCWNYRGEAFCLTDYVDPDTAFVSSKSKDGRELKALELPGLWNGAMADWITVFVEVPIETFNPVKTVNDLLKPMHQ